MRIEVRNLTHTYSKGQPDEQTALRGVSFKLEDGSFTAIIGHTGSGKSTLLQHLNGLLRPDQGAVVIGDVDITNGEIAMSEIRKKVGLVFQYPEYQLFEESVVADVSFGPKNIGLEGKELDIRVREAIELVGLDYEKIKDASPFELSGGQRRRVAIAGVLAMQPDVFILDEPTAGLDPKTHDEILTMIKTLHDKTNVTVILVSHNMDDVAKLADRVVVMSDGRIIMNDTAQAIFARDDELEKIGLDLPHMTKIVKKLRDTGLDIEPGLYDEAGAAAAIMDAIEKK